MIALLSAPSNLGLRPPQPGSVPGTAKAPEALREAIAGVKAGAADIAGLARRAESVALAGVEAGR